MGVRKPKAERVAFRACLALFDRERQRKQKRN